MQTIAGGFERPPDAIYSRAAGRRLSRSCRIAVMGSIAPDAAASRAQLLRV